MFRWRLVKFTNNWFIYYNKIAIHSLKKHEVDIDEVHMPIAYIAESWTEASDRQEMLFRYFKVVQVSLNILG